MNAQNIPKAIQLQETLDRLNEDLLSLSDDIWLNIDHNYKSIFYLVRP